MELAESEIDLLRSELHQSSDKEADIREKGCKAVKTIQDKLDAEIAAHGRTKEERDKLHEEGNKKETTIMALHEAAQKKQEWYDEQIENECQLRLMSKIASTRRWADWRSSMTRSRKYWSK